MKASKEEMKAEAIERMKLLELRTDVISDFEEGKLWVSSTVFGYNYFKPIRTHTDPDLLQIVKNFEKKYAERNYNLLCYHVIYTEGAMGPVCALLFVDEHRYDPNNSEYDYWEYEKSANRKGIITAFVTMLGDWKFERMECGSIFVDKYEGALVRTG